MGPVVSGSVRCPGALRRRSMRPAWSWKWLTLALVAPLWLISPAPSVRPATAQAGGTLVVGLDQEPPTLDPHASPSAVTYHVIGSVAEYLRHPGADGRPVARTGA